MNSAIVPNVDWVGYLDYECRDFHSFVTERGVTYNAYLVRGEKIALVDTVKAPFADKLIASLLAFTPLEKIDYVVCNHAEPDHSGALPVVLREAPNAVLVCTKNCLKTLSNYYDASAWKTQIVKTGDAISLGNQTLQFIETPMVHWPDNMFTYIPEDKLLFSMDAFGQHYASKQRFADELDVKTVIEEAKKYYANIVNPYGTQVAATLKKAAELATEVIAPSHGLAWRGDLNPILNAYKTWAEMKPSLKVVVLYDTMWDSTGKMAQAVCDGAVQAGVPAKLLHVRKATVTDIATETMDAAVIAVGSPTLNNGMMPMVSAALAYVAGLKTPAKAGFAFGSSGWSKGGPEAADEYMKSAMKLEMIRIPLSIKYKPNSEVIDECRAAGILAAETARKIAGQK